jgi:hypothetical protein
MKVATEIWARQKTPQTIELLSVLCVLLFRSLLFSFTFFSIFVQTFFAFALLIFFSQQEAHMDKPQKF